MPGDTCLSAASCVIVFPSLAVSQELRGTIPASLSAPVRKLTAGSYWENGKSTEGNTPVSCGNSAADIYHARKNVI